MRRSIPVLLVAASLVVPAAVAAAAPARDPHGLAAQQSSAIAPAGEYYYLDELAVQNGPSGSSTNNVRWWAANNGSGRVVESIRAHVASRGVSSSFSKTFAAGGYDSVAYPDRSQAIGHRVMLPIGSLVPLFWRFDPERLPTEPVALSKALRADVTKAARLERQGIYADRSVSEGTKELLLIANALQDPMDPPALRSALFTTALKLPGIAVQHGATDPLGRRGEAITASEGVPVEPEGVVNASDKVIFAVILNPKTRQILAETQYPSDHPAQARDFYTAFTGQVAVATNTTTPTTAG